MKRIHTISIGIPACNEEKNIGKLLNALSLQEGRNYHIEKIFVLSDMSTDRTDQIVSNSKTPKVKLLRNTRQRGKSYAIKKFVQLAHKNHSDFLLLIDADLTISDTHLVEKMVTEIAKDKKIVATSGFVLPKKPKNFVQKIAQTGFFVFDDMINRLPDALYYRSSDPLIILRVADFPIDAITSYAYLHDEFYYLYALKRRKQFTFEKEANAYFTLPKTFSDYNKQMRRYIGRHLSSDEVYPYHPYTFTILDRAVSLLRVGKTQFVTSMGYSLIQAYLHFEQQFKETSVQGSWEQIASTK